MAVSGGRRQALVTGAAGGMGRACARLFGATHDLILTDVAARPLAGFAEELAEEGYTIVGCHAGDLADEALLAALTAHLSGPFVLIHTAGLSPALADWRSIMSVNLVATELLLRAVEPKLVPGSVAVLIASMAGHLRADLPGAVELLADPLATGFLDRIGALAEAAAGSGAPAGAAGVAYSLSKAGVIDLVARRALAWGRLGARIVSISPGMILTPMGRRELAETPGARELDQAAPIGRSGIAMDIAFAARFLASEEATFITGCDLKVDGGGTAAVRAMMERAGGREA